MNKIIRNKFGVAVNKTELVVPHDYVHEFQMERFNREHVAEFGESYEVTDDRSKNTSVKIIPGRHYIIDFYPVLEIATFPQGIEFLQEKGALFTGPQGLSLAWEHKKECFPEGQVIELDIFENCYRNEYGGHAALLGNYRPYSKVFRYGLCTAIFKGDFLIAFTEKK